jgi:hypothetical protein
MVFLVQNEAVEAVEVIEVVAVAWAFAVIVAVKMILAT